MNKALKYTCLFGGGAIRGIAYIGSIKALEELGVSFDTIAGSSVGSVFAALLAVGYSADELKQIFAKVNFDLFRDLSIGIGPLFAISKGEVFLEWLRELIEKKYYGENYQKGINKAVTFKDIEKNLVIITTDLSNFECKEFSKFETPDYEIAAAIRISSCMPGLMKPVEYNKSILVDGDLQKSWPMWKLSHNLQNRGERILELRLEGNYNNNSNNDMSGINYANAVYSCMTAMATTFITDIYAKNDKYDYIVLDTGNIVVVNFNLSENKRNELIQSGYEQTMNYFKKALPIKKSNILNNYQNILRHLVKVQKLINSNNIFRAKIQIGELFLELCEYSDIIDDFDYKDIIHFKNLFVQNMHYPTFFGKIKINNSNLIKAELSKIISNITFKLDELNEYLEKYNQ